MLGLRNFTVLVRAPSDAMKESFFPFRRSLSLREGCISISQAEISFPASAHFFANRELIFKPSQWNPDQIVTLTNQPSWDHLTFAFPNQIKISILTEKPKLQDWHWFKIPILACSAVVVLHLLVMAAFLVPLNSAVKIWSKQKSETINISDMNIELASSNRRAYENSDGVYFRKSRSGAKTNSLLNKFRINSQLARGVPTRAASNSFNAFSQNSTITKTEFDVPTYQQLSLNIQAADVRRAFEQIQISLKECYEDALMRDQGLRGQPQIVVNVAATGTVEGLQIKHLQGGSESLRILQTCFQEAFQKTRFPKANQAFAVTQTIILSSD